MFGSHQLLEEAFCRGNIALRRENELNCISSLILGAVKIFTRFPNLDVDLVNSTGRTAHLQIWTDPFIDSGAYL
jgi:hypothetical protein